jgi:hypothetical protein
VLEAGRERPRLMREILAGARAAREKAVGGGTLGPEEALRLRYLQAVEKMQGEARITR